MLHQQIHSWSVHVTNDTANVHNVRCMTSGSVELVPHKYCALLCAPHLAAVLSVPVLAAALHPRTYSAVLLPLDTNASSLHALMADAESPCLLCLTFSLPISMKATQSMHMQAGRALMVGAKACRGIYDPLQVQSSLAGHYLSRFNKHNKHWEMHAAGDRPCSMRDGLQASPSSAVCPPNKGPR